MKRDAARPARDSPETHQAAELHHMFCFGEQVRLTVQQVGCGRNRHKHSNRRCQRQRSTRRACRRSRTTRYVGSITLSSIRPDRPRVPSLVRVRRPAFATSDGVRRHRLDRRRRQDSPACAYRGGHRSSTRARRRSAPRSSPWLGRTSHMSHEEWSLCPTGWFPTICTLEP